MVIGDVITTTRDCEAVLIPSGTHVTVPEGSVVHITQALGGSYTINVNGNLVRIAGKDADVLGVVAEIDSSKKDDNTAGDGVVDEELVWAQLKDCYDPEIPINIVELGLIYECKITPQDQGGSCIDILMTLTAPGCGMGDFLAEDVRSKVMSVDNVSEVSVEVTFEPPWDPSMMSDAARLATGMY